MAQGMVCWNKDAIVSEYIEVINGGGSLESNLCEAFSRNGKLKMFTNLFEQLYSIKIWVGTENKVYLILNKNDCFSVCSYYKALKGTTLSNSPWMEISVKVPRKVAIFAWTRGLGKFTTDNLNKRGLTMVNRCCKCKRNGAYVDHLFLHCPTTKEL